MQAPKSHNSTRERWHLLLQINRILDGPMVVLALIWLAILVLDLIQGLSPLFRQVSFAIWMLFIADFCLELFIAPSKGRYLRKNWITLISLFIPALRILRMFRAFRPLRLLRMARGLNLMRVVTTANRTISALRRGLRARGFGYVLALTILVNILGAAGMYAFEHDLGDPNGLNDFGTALWWTAMMLTTMGSQYWPKTPEGRLLALLLATYAFAIFGYITAAVASFFVGRDTARLQNAKKRAGIPAADKDARISRS